MSVAGQLELPRTAAEVATYVVAALTAPYFPGRDFGQGHGWGLPSGTRISPFRLTGLVCLLTTAADGPAAHLLSATTQGVAAALHSQPVELSWLRDAIREQLDDGSYPQLVLRLGTVIQDAISVRRPVSRVLTTRRAPQVQYQ